MNPDTASGSPRPAGVDTNSTSAIRENTTAPPATRAFAQMNAPGSIDGLIDRLRGELGIDVPGADILLSDIFAELEAGVLDAKHVGQGVVDGVECEHLAFRNADTDWQIWIQTGAQPVPRKYAITSKAVAGAPEYTLRMHNWIFGAASPEDGPEGE